MLDIDGPNIYVSTLDCSEGIISSFQEDDDHFFYGSYNILYKNEFSNYDLVIECPKFRNKPKKVRVL